MAPVAPDTLVKNDNPNVVPSTATLDMDFASPLLEIFYVRVHPKQTQDTPTLIYGNVTVIDGGETEIIWTRTQQNPSSLILPNQNILLEGPSRFLSASDPFSIDLEIHVVDPASDSDESLSICGGVRFNPLSLAAPRLRHGP